MNHLQMQGWSKFSCDSHASYPCSPAPCWGCTCGNQICDVWHLSHSTPQSLTHKQGSTSQTITFLGRDAKCCGQGHKGERSGFRIRRMGLCLSVVATVWALPWATHFISPTSSFVICKMGLVIPAHPTILWRLKEAIYEKVSWKW